MVDEKQSFQDESKQELGRRLFAALLSYRLQLSSMDYTLKKYVKGPIDPSWGELGWDLLTEQTKRLSEAITQSSRPAEKSSGTTEQILQSQIVAISEACMRGATMKLVTPFTQAPPPTNALFAAFVSCPDNAAKKLDEEVNRLIDEILGDHGYSLQPPTGVQ